MPGGGSTRVKGERGEGSVLLPRWIAVGDRMGVLSRIDRSSSLGSIII